MEVGWWKWAEEMNKQKGWERGRGVEKKNRGREIAKNRDRKRVRGKYEMRRTGFCLQGEVIRSNFIFKRGYFFLNNKGKQLRERKIFCGWFGYLLESFISVM